MLVTEPELSCPRRNDSAAGDVRIVRIPLYFESRGEPLFACWHTPGDASTWVRGAVIAPPIGYEQIHAHRSLRHLADALAKSGIPTLRFDWHGTGDSAGLDEDPDRLLTWQANLRDAVQLLNERFSIPRVSVIGLRLGATIAVTGLNECELENLVLWAPVVSGRTYVREMKAIDRTSDIPRSNTPGEPDDLEPSGLVLTEQTGRDLANINLLESSAPCCHTLILMRGDVSADDRLRAAYTAAGTVVDQATFPGYAEIFDSPHRGVVPQEAIQQIKDWLCESDEISSQSQPKQAQKIVVSDEMTTTYRPEGPASITSGTSLRERVLEISTVPHVRGILSEPCEPPPGDRPLVVMLNAGAAYRAGPGRLHVHLSRRLAVAGFRCLRLDVNGLGDSVADDERMENNSYSATVFRDIDLTLRFLREHNLGRRFVLLGLCSGAYAAFQSAVSLADPRLVESVLLNPLTFFWRDGMEIDDSFDRRLVVQHYYFGAALRPEKWLKLLTGKTKLGWRGAAKILVEKMRQAMPRPVISLDVDEDIERPAYSHPLRDDLPADLARVAEQNRQVAMFFADSDPGYAILTGKAGRTAKAMQKSGRLTIEFISQADHNFSRRSARAALFESLIHHLQRRYSVVSQKNRIHSVPASVR